MVNGVRTDMVNERLICLPHGNETPVAESLDVLARTEPKPPGSHQISCHEARFYAP
jgi:hypothetical protein